MATTKNNVPAINPEILDQMMAEVTAEVAEYLKQDVASLRKAAGEDAPDEESEGSSGPAEPAESSAPAEGGEEMGAAPEAAPEAGPDDSPMMDEASAAPEGTAAHEGGEIEPAPTVEGLQAEYMKLDPEALKMHYMACKGALMASMGAGQPDAGMAPEAPAAAPPAAPAAPPAAPEASAPPAMKAEAVPSGKELPSDEAANGGAVEKGKSLGKSEVDAAKDAEIAALKEQLKKNEEAVLELAIQLTKPLRKSVKGLSDLAFVPKTDAETEKKTKVANLSKTEIVAKLREVSRSNEKLKKSDRDLINKFTCGVEGVTVKDIEHLLTE